MADVEDAKINKRELGLADPDVIAVEVLVEVKALEMDMIMVRYTIKAHFKPEADGVVVNTDADTILQLHLPITTKPAQVPKIVSAGLAQSKYINDDLYSKTEPRKRYLWLEFAEPLLNKKDAYFIRMLAYSPDPLLARWESDMFKAPEEPTLTINPEPIRIISPDHTDDKSGSTANWLEHRTGAFWNCVKNHRRAASVATIILCS